MICMLTRWLLKKSQQITGGMEELDTSDRRPQMCRGADESGYF
jgi:hypothetical protein